MLETLLETRLKTALGTALETALGTALETFIVSDMSAMSSPEKSQVSPSPQRMSPYLVQRPTPLEKMNGNHSNVTRTNVSNEPEDSTYPSDPQCDESPQSPIRISGSSLERLESSPSSPEQVARRIHHEGIKLPGMSSGQVEEVHLRR